MKMNFRNNVVVTGYVNNFIVKTLKNGGRIANIGVRDELANNSCYVSLFERESLKYGDTPITLAGLHSTTMDSDGNPRHTLVKMFGKVAENRYTSKRSGREVVGNNITAFTITPCRDEADQKITFRLSGVVDSIKESSDGDRYDIRIGMLTKDRDGNYNGIEFNNLVAHGEVKEKLEDMGIEKNAFIDVAGLILNRREYDFYGMDTGTVREMRIESIGRVTPPENIDDLDVYKRIKSGKPIEEEDLPFDTATGSNKETKVHEKTDEELLAELGL